MCCPREDSVLAALVSPLEGTADRLASHASQGGTGTGHGGLAGDHTGTRARGPSPSTSPTRQRPGRTPPTVTTRAPDAAGGRAGVRLSVALAGQRPRQGPVLGRLRGAEDLRETGSRAARQPFRTDSHAAIATLRGCAAASLTHRPVPAVTAATRGDLEDGRPAERTGRA